MKIPFGVTRTLTIHYSRNWRELIPTYAFDSGKCIIMKAIHLFDDNNNNVRLSKSALKMQINSNRF